MIKNKYLLRVFINSIIDGVVLVFCFCLELFSYLWLFHPYYLIMYTLDGFPPNCLFLAIFDKSFRNILCGGGKSIKQPLFVLLFMVYTYICNFSCVVFANNKTEWTINGMRLEVKHLYLDLLTLRGESKYIYILYTFIWFRKHLDNVQQYQWCLVYNSVFG